MADDEDNDKIKGKATEKIIREREKKARELGKAIGSRGGKEETGKTETVEQIIERGISNEEKSYADKIRPENFDTNKNDSSNKDVPNADKNDSSNKDVSNIDKNNSSNKDIPNADKNNSSNKDATSTDKNALLNKDNTSKNISLNKNSTSTNKNTSPIKTILETTAKITNTAFNKTVATVKEPIKLISAKMRQAKEKKSSDKNKSRTPKTKPPTKGRGK